MGTPVAPCNWCMTYTVQQSSQSQVGWSSIVWEPYTRRYCSNIALHYSWCMWYLLFLAWSPFFLYKDKFLLICITYSLLLVGYCNCKWLQEYWRRQKNGTAGTFYYWKLSKILCGVVVYISLFSEQTFAILHDAIPITYSHFLWLLARRMQNGSVLVLLT